MALIPTRRSRRLAPLLLASSLVALAGCPSSGAVVDDPPPDEAAEAGPPPGMIEILEYEKKTAELLRTTEELGDLRGQLDDQARRLRVICTDYPEHAVCAPQTAASYAREAFCADDEFTRHVDGVVKACHQGQCKQVDQAELLTRSQYMSLITRLPHQLITFRAARSNLDRDDKGRLQQFVEQVNGEKGYVIIVGRASKDGPWRKNLKYALDRAESTRQYLVEQLGLDASRVGYITYGHEKMYLTELDAQRLSERKLSQKQANRSALVFSYPCWEGIEGAAP